MLRKAAACSVFGLVFLYCASVGAQTVTVELNKLEQQENACRAYLVLENTAEAFTQFKLDLVMFDAEGIVAKRLIVDASPLRTDKTSVKLFDIAGLQCVDIDRVLINDVPTCHDGAQTRSDCVDLVEARSVASAALIK